MHTFFVQYHSSKWQIWYLKQYGKFASLFSKYQPKKIRNKINSFAEDIITILTGQSTLDFNDQLF